MANAFTLFGQISVDTSGLQRGLRQAQSQLDKTQRALQFVKKSNAELGQSTAVTSRQYEKLNNSLQEQANRLNTAAKAYQENKIKGDVFAKVLNSVQKNLEKLSGTVVDNSAKLQTFKQKAQEAAAAAQKLAMETAALKAQKEAAKATAKAEADALRAAAKALREQERAVKEAARAAKQAAREQDRANKEIERAAKQAAREVERAKKAEERAMAQAARAAERASRETDRALKAAERAMRQAANAAQRAARDQERAQQRIAQAAARAAAQVERENARQARAHQQLMNKIAGVGSTIKGMSIDMAALVSGPLLGLGYAAFQSAKDFDALNNRLIAATGSQAAANAKFEHFLDLAERSVGVLPDMAAELYSAMKPLGLNDTIIDQVITAFGRLKTANANFDPTQFRINMEQMFTQGFEMQDVKQAFTYVTRFGELAGKAFNLTKIDRTSIAGTLRAAQEAGVLTMDNFFLGIMSAVNNDEVYSKLEQTIELRFALLQFRIKKLLKPLGDVLAKTLEQGLLLAIPILERMSNAFQAMSPGMQQLVVILGMVGAAIAPVMFAFGALYAIMAPFTKGVIVPLVKGLYQLAAVPVAGAISAIGVSITTLIAIVAAVVAAIAAAYYALSTNFGGIADALSEQIDQIWAIVKDMGKMLMDGMSDILNDLSGLWSDHGEDVKYIVKVLGFAVVGLIIGALEVIKAALKIIRSVIIPFIVNALKILITLVKPILGSLVGIISGAVGLIAAIFTGDWKGIIDNIWKVIENAVGLALNVFANFVVQILGVLYSLFPGLADFATKLTDGMKQLGMNIPAAIVQGIADRAGIVGKAIAGLFKGTVSAGGQTFDLSSIFSFDFKGAIDKAMADVKDAFKLDLSGFQGGGSKKGGKQGSQSATPKADPFQEEMAKLTLDLAKAKAELSVALGTEQRALELVNYELELQNGALKGLKQEDKDKLMAAQADIVATNQRAVAVTMYNDMVEEMRIATEQATAATELEKFAIELTGKAYKDLTEKEKDNLKLKKERQLQAEATAAAEKALKDAMTDFSKSIKTMQDEMKGIDTATESYRLEIALLNGEYKDATAETIRLAREKAVEADAVAKVYKAWTDNKKIAEEIIKKYTELGESLKPPKTHVEALNDALANPEVVKHIDETTLAILRRNAAMADAAEVAKKIAESDPFMRLKAEYADTTKLIQDLNYNALQDIGNVFASAVTQWDGTAKGFFRSIAQGFQQMAKQIIAELIRIAIMRAVLSIAGSIGSSGFTPGNFDPNEVPGVYAPPPPDTFASGGLIQGPGSGTSDSIVARLSNGEFVMPASAVKKFGVDFFESLRKGQMPMRGYAGGGMVMPSASSISTSNSTSNYNNVFNISVPAGGNSQQTATMLQKQVLDALKKHEKRNK